MVEYNIDRTNQNFITVRTPGGDEFEINIPENSTVIDAYVVNITEGTVDGEDGYIKETYVNGISDTIRVKKSQLIKEDVTSQMEMGKNYLFLRVADKDTNDVSPYYIKLPFESSPTAEAKDLAAWLSGNEQTKPGD